MSAISVITSSSPENTTQPNFRPCNCEAERWTCIKTTTTWCCVFLLPPCTFALDFATDIYSIHSYWNNEKICAGLAIALKVISFVAGIVYLTNLLAISKNSINNQQNCNEGTSAISTTSNNSAGERTSANNEQLNNNEQTSVISPSSSSSSGDSTTVNNEQLNDNEITSCNLTTSSNSGGEHTPATNEQLNNNEQTSLISPVVVEHSGGDSTAVNNEPLSDNERASCISTTPNGNGGNDTCGTKFKQFTDCLERTVPIFWYLKMLRKACGSKIPNKRQYMLEKALIQIIENYLENAPQSTITIYVLLKKWNEDIVLLDFLGILLIRVISLVALCWSTVGYRQAIRKSQDKQNVPPLTRPWKIFFTLLNISQIGPRIILLALLANKCQCFFSIVIVGHFVTMLTTLCALVKTKQEICQSGFGMIWHRAVFAFIYIYTYVSISKDTKYTVITVFYVANLFQNVLITSYIDSCFCIILFTIWFWGACVYCLMLINDYKQEKIS